MQRIPKIFWNDLMDVMKVFDSKMNFRRSVI